MAEAAVGGCGRRARARAGGGWRARGNQRRCALLLLRLGALLLLRLGALLLPSAAFLQDVELVFVAFDIIYYDGHDVSHKPLSERHRILGAAIPGTDSLGELAGSTHSAAP